MIEKMEKGEGGAAAQPPSRLRRLAIYGWRPLLVTAAFALGWHQSGPVIDFGAVLNGDGRSVFGRSIPTHCSSIMIGYACSLKNGNDHTVND